MKTICFIRHAKSSWETPCADIDRPLNSRGIKDAVHVGQELYSKNLTFDALYSSTAKRAQITTQLIVNELDIEKQNIIITDALYTFEDFALIDFIKNLPAKHDNVIIVGHNPAFTSVINDFSNMRIDNVPTCGVVVVDFDINSWCDLQKGTTSFYIIPKLMGYR